MTDFPNFSTLNNMLCSQIFLLKLIWGVACFSTKFIVKYSKDLEWLYPFTNDFQQRLKTAEENQQE